MPDTAALPTVAVVDDNPLFLDMATEWLAFSFENRVKAFGDGRSAWDHLKQGDSADIIVSDVNMPGMSGLDLLARIKGRFPNKICILVSGNPENENAAASMGADKFMAKPFSMRDLIRTMQSLYANGKDRAA